MTVMDRIVAWNARQSQRWFVPNLVFKAIAGFLLAGVILAILVPALHVRGVALEGWMIWGVMVLMIVVCTAPDVYQRYRRNSKQ